MYICSSKEPEEEKVEDQNTVEQSTEKPQKKKRKPTAKQLEEAEAAARPRYDPNTDRPPEYTGEATRILSWNVTSLNATLRKDPEAINKLAEDNKADVICLQVPPTSMHYLEPIFMLYVYLPKLSLVF